MVERYQNTLWILGVAAAVGAVMFAIIAVAVTTNSALAVGGTFWATGVFLGIAALPER